MNQEFLLEIKEKIEMSELVLVGIGEQVAVPTRQMENELKFKIDGLNDEKSYLYPYLQQVFIKENSKPYIDFYNRVFELIKDKNYYVLTTNVDDVIYQSKLDANRIVSPCGSIHQFVCQECKEKIKMFSQEDVEINQKILNQNSEKNLKYICCEKCNKPLMPNIVSYEYYDENGYLEKWQKYTKWLQGTVNKKLCILELGVGLGYPTVIRWPNERIVSYNNKAFLYRVHEKLYQLSEGIGDRAKSIAENPMNVI